tara:strand:- start:491 stop:982 length:492 start_codon:yes stop_codon:yes gene_type:complete
MTTKTVSVKKKAPPAKLPPNPLQSEILAHVSKQRTKAKKVEQLKALRNPCLVSLLIWNFDPSIESAIPEGEVPFKENPEEQPVDGVSRLNQHTRTLYNFVKGGNLELSRTRREALYIQLLESIHKDEAKVLNLVKDKNLQSEYKIDQAIVSEAYPDIKWGNRV